jgi:hypothetical protein
MSFDVINVLISKIKKKSKNNYFDAFSFEKHLTSQYQTHTKDNVYSLIL